MHLIIACLTATLSISISLANAQAQTYIDVVYASISSSNKLDIYLPTSASGPFPTIVIIHGGGFSGGDKGSESTYAEAMVSRGFAVSCINYRLSGEAIFPAQIYDVKAAIRFLKANASTYSLDTNKFATWGESAGGGLAALAGTSGDDTIVEDMSMGNSNHTSRVKAVVDFSGPIDFLSMNTELKEEGITNGQDHDTSTSPESVLVGGAIQTKKDLCNEYNPETYISSDDGYFWLEYGTADNGVPYLQGVVFADSLATTIPASRVSLHIITGAGHVDPLFFTDSNLDSVATFLDSALSTTATPVRQQDNEQPSGYELNQNYPNPFNPSTTLSYQLETQGHVSLVLYNVLGEKIAQLVDEVEDTGYHQLVWDASRVSSGIYYARLLVTDNKGKRAFNSMEKLLLIK
jgi:pimeloyl-ACP methyl ester carboxylesterase